MPFLDVSELMGDVDLSDSFSVIRRTETVDNNGFSQVVTATYAAIGVIYPVGDNQLQRESDFDATRRTIVIYTKFRLQATSPGIKPDNVVWDGNTYIVERVEPYSRFGAGFIEVRCTTVALQDAPSS